jgi:YD repeat-containing protein
MADACLRGLTFRSDPYINHFAKTDTITSGLDMGDYALTYDAENRLTAVSKNGSTIATFVFDGDGKRVISTADGATTRFVSAGYEVKNPGASQEVSKYYFAGASRIAVRKYTVPQSMSVEYTLSDHLGSASITTDNAGAKVSEIRYKPWGEIRYAWTDTSLSTTPAYKLTSYTYTGQFSYMDDPTTPAPPDLRSPSPNPQVEIDMTTKVFIVDLGRVGEGLSRFSSADTIVPGVGTSQAWDRYAYGMNNPLRYIDPTGHDPCDPDDTECQEAQEDNDPVSDPEECLDSDPTCFIATQDTIAPMLTALNGLQKALTGESAFTILVAGIFIGGAITLSLPVLATVGLIVAGVVLVVVGVELASEALDVGDAKTFLTGAQSESGRNPGGLLTIDKESDPSGGISYSYTGFDGASGSYSPGLPITNYFMNRITSK